MKYLVIADRKHIDAFKAIGVAGIAVSTADEGDRALSEALEDRQISAILVTRDIMVRNSEKISAHEKTGRYPVVLGLD